MLNQFSVTFQDALDTVETLPDEQQENLIEIVQRRLIDRRRQTLAKNITKARREYAQGELKKGTVDDLMKELSQ